MSTTFFIRRVIMILAATLFMVLAFFTAYPFFVDRSSASTVLAPFNIGEKATAVHPFNGKWGFLNAEGEVAIEPEYALAYPFAEGLAYVMNKDKHGFIDQQGRWKIILPQDVNFAYPIHFSEGLAAVEQNGRYGYIDSKGEFVIEPQYEFAFRFQEGFAPVQTEKDGKWGVIDKKGELVIEPQFDFPASFEEGYLYVEDRRAYLDSEGKVADVKPQDPNAVPAGPFSEGLAAIEVDNKYGAMNRNGETVIEPEYELLLPFREGYALVRKDGLYGYVDKKGKLAIDAKFQSAYFFVNGLACVKFNGQWGFVDETGEFAIEPQYDAVKPIFPLVGSMVTGPFSNLFDQLAVLEKGGKVYIAFEGGRRIVEIPTENMSNP